MRVSTVQQRGTVPFPVFLGERIHMRAFTKSDGLAPALRRWQPTVDAMLDGIDVDGPIFLMIDQADVPPGSAHRRPGVHVDGYWQAGAQAHKHNFEPEPAEQPPADRHVVERQFGIRAETILLATDVLGCVAYAGSYDDQPAEGGDCSHIDVSKMDRVEFEPGRVWAGSALGMLHESIAARRAGPRTVVRLNVPGWA